MLEVKPQIVHFCGHGTGNQGLVLEDNDGNEHLASTEALSDLFRIFAEQVECVNRIHLWVFNKLMQEV